MSMKVLSVNVSLPQDFEFEGQTIRTAIFKRPVSGAVALGQTHLAGDGQANLAVHGGIHKAVYAYSHDHYGWWAKTLGRDDLSCGQFGENLTIAGMDEKEISIGDRLRIGSTLLAVTGPRIPCAKLGYRFNDKTMPGKFTEAARPGCYFRVIESGTIEAGNPVDLLPGSPDNVSIKEMYLAYCKPRSSAAVSILEQALLLPDLDPAFVPNIKKRLRASGNE